MKVRIAKEAITSNHQINAFHCQQRWVGHKEDMSKSMKKAMYVLWYTKKHLSAWCEVEK